ncbi:MAG: methyltransferase [Alphaproteobacteria bacterium]|nr:methyltransferase [Alphaproteobacteria bacterium]
MSQEIHVLDKKVRLLQPAQGFRTSMDTVLLAAACRAQAGDNILDLGCGVGAAGLCVLWRVPDVRLTGLDIQAAHIDLARQNAALNHRQNNAQFIVGDVRDWAVHRDGHKPEFDHVLCNPPFLEAGTYTVSPRAERARALGHDGQAEIELKTWIDAAFYHLKNSGCLTLIHRADYLDKILLALESRFGGVEIIPLWPRAGQPAKRVILRAVKNSKAPCVLHSGVVLHEADGTYTQNADALLRTGVALA